MKSSKFSLIILNVWFLLLTGCRDIPADKADMQGDDYRLFQGTIAWDLAKAVEDQNVPEIKRQVKKLKVPVDYKEEKFGGTLLMLAVRTNKYRSVKTLLSLGANPNTPNDTVHNFGRNAVIFASMFDRVSADILRLLLENGGNPNSVECGVQEDGFGNFDPACNSALFYAIFASFEKVKILVEAGADVNLETSATDVGAMYAAFAHQRMDILLYLLEHGADYHRKFERVNLDDPNYPTFKVSILYELRLQAFPLDSKMYQEKLKVIAFLKRRGLDYWKYPYPDGTIEIIKREMEFEDEHQLQYYLKKY